MPELPRQSNAPDPTEVELLAEADRLNAAIASCHERVVCPRCRASIGRRCRRVGTFVSDSPPLKHPHAERVRADGIEVR